uniref:Uncharacterized protein n=1 Tax=Ralstonia solanacearum CFBP2957 TaxID=859656 RepID=D8P3F2_RALSL|nr:protein of unknown function [Ralstonia solanacearum CFBP2957]
MARIGRPETPQRIRFLAKFAIGAPGDCWRWTAATHPQGYDIAARFNVSASAVGLIKRRERWAHL